MISMKTNREIVDEVIGNKFPRGRYQGYERVDATCYRLRVFQNKTFEEISEELDLSVQIIKNCIARCWAERINYER